jgi:hypothetical protein
MVLYKSSSTSFLESVVTTLHPSRRAARPNSSSVTLTRAVGWTTAVGLSLIVLRSIGQTTPLLATKSLKENRDAVHADWNHNARVCFEFCRTIARQAFFAVKQKLMQRKQVQDDPKTVIRTGSCHCEAVEFEVRKSHQMLRPRASTMLLPHVSYPCSYLLYYRLQHLEPCPSRADQERWNTRRHE